MPKTTVEIPKLDEVITQKKDRDKLVRLFNDRAFMSCRVNLWALTQLLHTLGVEDPPEAIAKLVSAWNDEEERAEKDRLNNDISAILVKYDIDKFAAPDVFGQEKVCTTVESYSTSRPIDKIIACGVKLGLSAEKMKTAIQNATVKTPYTTLQIRSVKDKEGEQ